MRPRSGAATDGGPLGRVIRDGGPDQTRAKPSLALLRAHDNQTYPQAENKFALSRNRHCHGNLDRKHREGNDHTQRQRADRERCRDGVGHAGRCDRRGAAVKPCSAKRPFHGRVSLEMRGRITRSDCNVAGIAGNFAAGLARKWQNGGRAIASYFRPKPRRRCLPHLRLRCPGANPWPRIQGFARSASTRRGSRGKSQGRNRSGRRHGCSRRARCPRP